MAVTEEGVVGSRALEAAACEDTMGDLLAWA